MIAEAVKSGKTLEIDSAHVIKKEDYVLAPLMKGYISTEGVLEQLEEQEELLPMTEGEVDDFLIHSKENFGEQLNLWSYKWNSSSIQCDLTTPSNSTCNR